MALTEKDAAVDPREVRLFHQPEERLRVTIAGLRSYHTVKPVWAAPLSRPGHYLALLDGDNKEIVLVADPRQLPADSRAALERELQRRYLTANVTAIVHARQDFGATYWTVETDRGPRDFVTQSLQENALWFSETHLLLVDVDGNRFEIPDTTALDEGSRKYIHNIL